MPTASVGMAPYLSTTRSNYPFRNADVQGRRHLKATPTPVTIDDRKDLSVDENHPRPVKRWAAAAIKLLIVALVVWFIRRTIVDAWEQLGTRRWQFDFWWLAASGGLYLLGTLCCGVFWHRTLRVMGQPVSLPQALRAYYIGQLGKYVPGKAMVVILRAGLVRGQGVDTALAAASVFLETLTMMSTGALMAAAIVAVWFRGQTLLFWAALGHDGRRRSCPRFPPCSDASCDWPAWEGRIRPSSKNWPTSAMEPCFSAGR